MRRIIKNTGKLLIWTEILLHFVVFIMLVLASALIIYDSLITLERSHFSILILISNALLLLVIKEIIWTVLQFFKREKFSLSPFLYVGVISGIREILFLGIQKSIEKGNATTFSLEILANAAVIFLLVLSYYLFKRARLIAGENS